MSIGYIPLNVSQIYKKTEVVRILPNLRTNPDEKTKQKKMKEVKLVFDCYMQVYDMI